MSTTLATSSGSVENLNVSAFQGLTPYSFHTAATVAWSTPTRGASSRGDQCVTPSAFGGGVNGAATIAPPPTWRRGAGPVRPAPPPLPAATHPAPPTGPPPPPPPP